MNVAKVREDVVLEEGEQVSFLWKDQEITNFQYNSDARKLVSVLKELGIKRGDRVIVQMPNCIEVLQSYGAIWRMGAICVPINYLMGDDEIAHIYRDSGAKAVISSKIFLPKILHAKENSPELKHIILVEDDAPEGTLSYHNMVNGAKEDTGIVETDDDENAALIYTAGTTGHPKGVVLTHYAMYANAKMQFESMPFPHGLTNMLVLPLCHSFGLAVANSGMFRRRTKAVILNTFDVDTIFSTIEKYRVEFFAGVPTMYILMLLHPDPKKYDLSTMKYWMCGSAPLSMETWKRFKEVYGGTITEGWGLSEGGANNCSNPIDGRPVKVGSIGLPMKGTEVRIMDDSGNNLGANEQGEIVIKGPSVMKEYWNQPEETARAIVDGWLHTGDVGYYDKDGYFWITDRKKDLIIKGGENISPRSIEEVLYQHPKVAEAAVIAMKDEKYGENIKAFVVLKPEQEASKEDIIEHCKGHLTNFLLPQEVVFLDAFPKSIVGKILKKELRKM